MEYEYVDFRGRTRRFRHLPRISEYEGRFHLWIRGFLNAYGFNQNLLQYFRDENNIFCVELNLGPPSYFNISFMGPHAGEVMRLVAYELNYQHNYRKYCHPYRHLYMDDE